MISFTPYRAVVIRTLVVMVIAISGCRTASQSGKSADDGWDFGDDEEVLPRAAPTSFVPQEESFDAAVDGRAGRFKRIAGGEVGDVLVRLDPQGEPVLDYVIKIPHDNVQHKSLFAAEKSFFEFAELNPHFSRFIPQTDPVIFKFEDVSTEALRKEYVVGENIDAVSWEKPGVLDGVKSLYHYLRQEFLNGHKILDLHKDNILVEPSGRIRIVDGLYSKGLGQGTEEEFSEVCQDWSWCRKLSSMCTNLPGMRLAVAARWIFKLTEEGAGQLDKVSSVALTLASRRLSATSPALQWVDKALGPEGKAMVKSEFSGSFSFDDALEHYFYQLARKDLFRGLESAEVNGDDYIKSVYEGTLKELKRPGRCGGASCKGVYALPESEDGQVFLSRFRTQVLARDDVISHLPYMWRLEIERPRIDSMFKCQE